MALGTQLLLLASSMAATMALGWLWQRRRRNAGIVDVLWSLGLGGAALLMASTGPGAPLPRALLALLAGGWAMRLGLHLWGRVRSEAEDGRYQHLRRHWHTGTQWKFFALFQAQALLVVLFALPFAAVARDPRTPPASALCAALFIWVASVAGESIADGQLRRFRRQPGQRARTCRIGLWRYSRHPNYFFEWLQWFAYVALASNSPLAPLAWSGPVLMFVFLRWISGVPQTEAQALRTRGEDYRRYQRTTPTLFPWFPKVDPTSRSVR